MTSAIAAPMHDRIAAASALGIWVTVAEMQELQRTASSGVTEHLLDRNLALAAIQPDLHPVLVHHLRRHPDAAVASAARFNGATTRAELENAFGQADSLESVTPAAELHGAIPLDLLEYLTTHESWQVRGAAVRNYSAPAAMRDRMVADPNPSVAGWATMCRGVVLPLVRVEPQLSRIAIDWSDSTEWN